MSFADVYKARYEKVIAPAIRGINVDGVPLRPVRVDFSKSGDSILTDIMDGIAHSQMILADVSTFGHDSKTTDPYRNSNVMYEVGIALACRQPQEVLLIRDDKDPFLFDVSTIYHMKLDFTQVEEARESLKQEMIARLNERKFVEDIRIRTAIDSLSSEEMVIHKEFAKRGYDQIIGYRTSGMVTLTAIPRLLDKQLIILAGKFEEGHPGYRLTTFGRIVAELAESQLTTFKADPIVLPPTPTPIPEDEFEYFEPDEDDEIDTPIATDPS